MAGALTMMLGSGGFTFTPVTNTHSTPGSGSETVPPGATSLTITVRSGSGEAGGYYTDPEFGTFHGAGGGGGAQSTRTIAIAPSDWNGSLNYTVGGAGAGGAINDAQDASNDGIAGGNSSVTGTLNAGSVNMTCTGGGGGLGGWNAGGSGGGGSAGTASGGTTNTNGSPGGNVSGLSGGLGGAGGGGAPAGGGADGGDGGAGSVIFAWT